MEEKKILNEENTEEACGGSELTFKKCSAPDLTNKKKFLESVKHLQPIAGEIPSELLEKVSGGSVFGGELNDWDKDYLDLCISDYKAHGVDLERTLRYMMKSNFSNEALWYVGTHWDA
jgi:hypothetical protein